VRKLLLQDTSTLPPAVAASAVADGAELPSSTTSSPRHGSSIDFSLCRLTVIHTHFWEAIEALLKLVEFRSPRQSIPFFPVLLLLFSLNAAERRTGRHELLAAAALASTAEKTNKNGQQFNQASGKLSHLVDQKDIDSINKHLKLVNFYTF
jgi:hypothetical protein